MFTEDEAARICQIPINAFNGRGPANLEMQRESRVLNEKRLPPRKELAANNKGDCSYVRRQNNVWKRLWKMNVLNAAKVFMRRTCNNVLPTNANLIKYSRESVMPYMWIKGGDYGAYIVELPSGKRCIKYVWEETTKELRDE